MEFSATITSAVAGAPFVVAAQPSMLFGYFLPSSPQSTVNTLRLILPPVNPPVPIIKRVVRNATVLKFPVQASVSFFFCLCDAGTRVTIVSARLAGLGMPWHRRKERVQLTEYTLFESQTSTSSDVATRFSVDLLLAMSDLLPLRLRVVPVAAAAV